MEISDLKIGMLIDGNQRCWNFQEYLRIEFVAYDWAVGRGEDGDIYLIRKDDMPVVRERKEGEYYGQD